MGLVSWMYLHLRFDAHPGTLTQYHSMHICQYETDQLQS
ncbi:unnamed protein product [Schistosoma mattheei]|uniref:Uncharacterized protein n=1 Tax=Schistosoma mattheei TaxID=31246 RepID=A0A3P8KM50_9TREM|nr:unnamed protein product [Schistosoma mattheei]